MLHVILQILAIIGIIFLCILGFSLLLTAVVLFVPIRYRAKGKREGEVLEATVKATYLLHLLTVKFAYPEPGTIAVRLFGIKIYESARTKAEDKKDIQTEVRAETKSGADTEDRNMSEKENVSENEVPEDVSKQEKEKKSLIDKIQYTFNTICDKIRNIIEKIKEVFQNISYYKEILTKTENKKLYGRIKERILKVLKSIRPRVIKADLRIGTGSPDTTAYIYGIYGMIMPILGKNVKNIHIDLDFENTVYEGEVFLKGRITLFTILVQAVKVALDKQLHVFLKQLKREE